MGVVFIAIVIIALVFSLEYFFNEETEQNERVQTRSEDKINSETDDHLTNSKKNQ